MRNSYFYSFQILFVLMIEIFFCRYSNAQEKVQEKKSKEEQQSKKIKPPDTPFIKNCTNSDCHADIKKHKRLHGPVAANSCDPCHKPKPPGHHFELARKDSKLCTFCHLSMDKKKYVHLPVEEDPCITCHDPHGSETKFILTNSSVAKLCKDCHSLPKDKFIHGPVSVGGCAICHEPHQSDYLNLLRKPTSVLCLECHTEISEVLNKKKYVHKPATKTCESCHQPHSGKTKDLLKKENEELCLSCHKDIKTQVTDMPVVHGAIKELNECSNCHLAHASDMPFLLKDITSKLCLTCHNKVIETPNKKKLRNIAEIIEKSKFLHGPIKEGDCTACHRAHASENFRLLIKDFPKEFYKGFDLKNYALCFSCHQKALVLDKETTTLTGFRDGNKNLHYVHVNKKVKGRTCRACHAIHGSNLPKHIRKEVPFGSGGWELPIGFKKTANGGTCNSGCHKPYSYDRTKLPSKKEKKDE